MTPAESVTSLLPILQAGEQAAIQQLWERYRTRLIQLARAKFKCHGARRCIRDAGDVALSAFGSDFWPVVGIALLTADPLRGADDVKEAKFDAAKLVGTWQYVSGAKNGQKVDEARLRDQKVAITKDTITLKGEAGTFVMKYELDPKKTPATVKLTMTESPFGAGATAEGIIGLNGDELRLCYAPMGGAAPKTFEAKEGSSHHLFVLKRSK